MAHKMPKIELIIVVAFLFAVVLWSISQCNRSRTARANTEPPEEAEQLLRKPVAVKPETVYVPAPRQEPVASPTTNAPLRRPTLSVEPTASPAAPAATNYSTLYVTIDGLNLRNAPNRHSAVIARLKLYEPVLFLNEKSEQPEEINLGREKVKEHWVRIRTQQGKEGWVFGAGLHYYPTKRPGVE